MRRFALRPVAALVPVAVLAATTLTFSAPAGAADPPEVNVGDVSIVEGDAGTNTMKFPVTLSDPAATDVIVEWTVTAGSATAGTDYVALKKPKTTKIKAGKTAAFASVKQIADGAIEGDETFSVTVLGITGGPAVLGDHDTGTGTILDDEGSSEVSVGVGDAGAIETDTGSPKIALPFTLSSPLPSSEVWVTWDLAAGSATPGSEYKPLTKPKVTKIKAGKTSAQGTVTAYGDMSPELDETLTVTITGVSVIGAPVAVDVQRATGTGTIVDDDAAPDPTEAPGTPTNVQASNDGTDTVVDVTWDAPTTGDPATAYNYEYTDDGGANWYDLGNGGSTPAFSISMSYGTYQYRVQATNDGGAGPWSAPSNEITLAPAPVEVPGAPSNVVASLTAENFVHATWDPPTTGGAPTQYNYEYSSDGGTTWINLGGGDTTAALTAELGPGTYRVRVQGENAGGPGPWSLPSNDVTVPEDPCNPFCPG